MLTSAEKRKIRRYATLHKSMIGICIMIGFSPIFALAMIIFDAIVLEREHLSPILGSVVMIGPTIFYLPVGLYVCFGLLHSLRHSSQWLDIVHKVAASNGITEQSAPDSYDTTIIGLRFHPEAVAAWAQIKPSSIKRRQALILLGPVLLQILLFTPHMVDSWTILEAKKDCAAAVIQQLDETFSQSFSNTIYDDPHEDYQRAGYHYIARLPKTENFENIHMTVTVSNSGKIEDISYWCDVNVNLSKEENMAAAKQGIEKLHEVLLAANPPFVSDAQTEIFDFSDEFWTAFCEGSYYEEISMDEAVNENTYVSYQYYTRPEDQYEEYPHSDVALFIDVDIPVR